MRRLDPRNIAQLNKQLDTQVKHAWDLNEDINWQQGIDISKPFLPLDENNFAFPKASKEQQIAISQFLGLALSESFSEMESAMQKFKMIAWEAHLKKCNPSQILFDLGEQFFFEETKHSEAFVKFRNLFAETQGFDPELLRNLLPQAFGSVFIKMLFKNAQSGGLAFWWTVANIEESSIMVYQSIQKVKAGIDPLFVQLHQKHAEEELRHESYAFLMLELFLGLQKSNPRQWLHRKTDYLTAELGGIPWLATELMKIFKTEDLKHEHPYFKTLASCIPLFQSFSKIQLTKSFLSSMPYVSTMINSGFRHKHREFTKEFGSLEFPWIGSLKPRPVDLHLP